MWHWVLQRCPGCEIQSLGKTSGADTFPQFPVGSGHTASGLAAKAALP